MRSLSNSKHLTSKLPFGFAKRHSVLLEKTEQGYCLLCLSDVAEDVLLEVRRFFRSALSNRC